ncbi:MAG: TIGR03936 family radical SAM-associated protein [Bilifractor sp.]|jgi:radical SAM-linked protein
MRVRIKFSKTGCLKFIGHLDVMRFFQKAIRRAELPVSLSEGYSPHMLMSFAAPLGVGKTSSGEYFDLDLKEEIPEEEILERLNVQMVPGMHAESCVRIGITKAEKCMTLVNAADYTVSFRKGSVKLPDPKQLQEKLNGFLSAPSVIVLRKTKRSEAETDILPWIYEMNVTELDDRTLADHPQGTDAERTAFHMLLSAGSVSNLKPELVMNAFSEFAGFDLPALSLLIHRNDIYTNIGTAENRELVPLDRVSRIQMDRT